MPRHTVEFEKAQAEELLNLNLPAGITHVSVKHRIHKGQSGATVWEVDIESRGSRGGLAIAKFDDFDRCQREKNGTNEAQMLSITDNHSPKCFAASKRIEYEAEGHIYSIGFLLMRKARDERAKGIDTLESVIKENRRHHRELITDQVKRLVETIYADWYQPLTDAGGRHPVDLLEAFAKLLNVASTEDRVARLEPRLDEYFALPATTSHLIVRVDHHRRNNTAIIMLPNPAYYLTRTDLWAEDVRHIQTYTTPMHGDLHTGNVMCQVERIGTRPLGITPWLIDFANYESEGLPFYDLVQLEFDILRQYLTIKSAEDWGDWMDMFPQLSGENLYPNTVLQGERAIFAWELIAPIRRFAQDLIDRAGKRAQDIDTELSRLWRLCMTVIGMRAAQRDGEEHWVRSAGLIYAAYGLKQLSFPFPPFPFPPFPFPSFPFLSVGKPKAERRAVDALAPRFSRLYTPHKYSPPNRFVGRVTELAQLDGWANSEDHILEVIAIGGQGKSALMWEWFTARMQKALPGLTFALWWSFYESEGIMSRFVENTLRYLTRITHHEIDQMNREEREDALIEACRKENVLFVFDGLERILNAYRTLRHATQTDDETDRKVDENTTDVEHPRACANPQDSAFLHKLLDAKAARVVISTRLPVRDLEDKFFKSYAGVRRMELKGLHGDDVLALMGYYDVTGNRWKMIDFAKSFEAHPLLLTLMIGKIREFHRARGDFDQWYEYEGKNIKLEVLDIKQNHTRILDYALNGLTADVAALLSRLSVFNYPFDFDAAMAIHPFAERYYSAPQIPPRPFSEEEYQAKLLALNKITNCTQTIDERYSIRELEEIGALRIEIARYLSWQSNCIENERAARLRAHKEGEIDVSNSLYVLEDRGLVTYDFGRRVWDMHPIVRGYAYNVLRGDPQSCNVFECKQNYFMTRETNPYQAIQDIDDLRPELEIYDALIQSGELDRASDFYSTKLQDILFYQLSMYHEIVRLLLPLFPQGLNAPPKLSSRYLQRERITNLANAYHQIQMENAVRLRTLNIRLSLRDKSVGQLVVDIGNFSFLWLETGEYGSMIAARRLGLRLAQIEGFSRGTTHMRRLLFEGSVMIGAWVEAETCLAQISLRDFHDGERTLRQSEIRRYEAEMYLARDDKYLQYTLAEAESLANKARSAEDLREIERIHGELATRFGDGVAAARHFERYLEMRQKVRLSVNGARGGLAHAYFLQGKYPAAQAQLEAGTDNLSAAEVWLALSERVTDEKVALAEKAKTAALAAYKDLWGEGKPYCHYKLPRAEVVLNALGVPLPDLPVWDESKRLRLPEEDLIIAFIEKLEAEKAAKKRQNERE